MNKKLFREKSMERVSSPDQLNDRIRVTNSGVWLLLAGILLVLTGIVVWAIYGRVNTLLPAGAITESGHSYCYVREADYPNIHTGMKVQVEDTETEIVDILPQPIQVDRSFPEYLCHIDDLATGEWVYIVRLADTYGEEGSIFPVRIVLETIAPASFVVN